MGVHGEERAVEEHIVVAAFPSAGDTDRGEVLDLEVADLVSLVFDIHPAELGVREFLGKREKSRPVLDAGIAPFRAKAAHYDHA